MYGDDIWWYSFYDCDSSLGLDNTGYMKFEPDIEPSQPNVYNCSNSKMWVKLNAFFKAELYNNFKILRESNYTYEKVCEYLIENQIDQIPDILYNEDMYSKYITQGRRYLHMLHGNNKAHLLRWLYNRFLYVDSLFLQHNSPYTKESITIRSCKPTEVPSDLPEGVQYIPKFEIETYATQYITVCWRKNTYETKRVSKGEKVIFENQMTNSQDNELIIYCANNLKRIGDCSDKNPTSIDIGFATRLVEFKCENSTELLKADLSKNSYLREVSFNGCSQLGNTTGGANVLDVSSCTNLRKVDIRGTAITTVLTNVDGGNLEEIYYGSSIQNITIKNQTNLKVLGLPIEPPQNLVTVDIVNCPNVEKINVSQDNYTSLNSMKYVQNLSIQNSLDFLTTINFKGFNKLKTFKLQDMLRITSCGLDDMYDAEDISTLNSIILSNCPKITTLTMNVTSDNKYVKFNNNATLDLRNATSIKTIISNTSILGLKTMYLPNSLEKLLLGFEYHTDVPSDIINIWSNDSVNTCLAESYEGIDGKNLNIKSLDLSSVKKIPNTRNLNTILESNSKFIINQTRDGLTYPYLVYRGTINLDNYRGSLTGFFKGWIFENVVIIKNNNFTQTDFTSMFEDAILNDMDLTSLFNKMPNATNLSSMFKNTNLTSDILIPSNVVNCSSMFENCDAMTHIHSNWNNEYNDTIVATNCYKGCTSINNIDGEDLILNSYTMGLDNVPPAWGGYSFLKEYTGIYKITIPSDNFTFYFYYAEGDPQYHCLDDGLTSWGDGKVDSLVISHTYEKAGDYYIKTKMFLGAYGKLVSPDFKSYMTEVVQFPTNMSNIVFQGCSNVTSINVSGCVNATNIERAFQDCSALTTIVGLKDIFNSNINATYCCFYGCSSLTTLDLSNIDVSNVTNMSNMFQSCTALTELNMDNWDTSNLTRMSAMFYDCTSLTSLDLSHFNVSKLQQIESAFYNCKALTSINLTGWEVAPLITMNSTFLSCESLESLEVNHLNTVGVTDMGSTFTNTKSLTALDISNWDLSNVKFMSSMLRGSSVAIVNYPTMEAPNLTDSNAFASNCPNLTKVYINMPSTVKKIEGMIQNTPNIEDFGVINLDGLGNLVAWYHLNAYSNPTNKAEIRFRFKGTLRSEHVSIFRQLFIYPNNTAVLYDKFSKQTLIDLIDCLNDYSGTETTATLELGTVNLAKLTEDEILVATNKNWTLT